MLVQHQMLRVSRVIPIPLVRQIHISRHGSTSRAHGDRHTGIGGHVAMGHAGAGAEIGVEAAARTAATVV